MSVPFLQGVAQETIRQGSTVIYAAIGEVIVERAGMVNLGLEGTMLTGACFGYIITSRTGSPYLGLLVAALSAGLFNMIFGFLAVTRRANQLAAGLTVLFFAYGITAIAGSDYVNRQINSLPEWSVPGLASIPGLGPVVFKGDLLIFTIVPAALLAWYLLYRTRWGLQLRTVGESRTAAYAAGINPERVQYEALFVGGLFAGLGGAQLSLFTALVWREQMTSGKGFIAVALVIFASWHPLRVLAGAALFGGAVALQLQLQAHNAHISPVLLDMLPYMLTLGVLVAWGRNRQYQMPQGITEVFEGTI